MNIFNSWITWIILYVFLAVVFVQFYKIATKNIKKDGALTVTVELLGGTVILLFTPFFNIKFPTDPKIYILLLIACIFYAINDRLKTTARKGLEASTFSILNEISTIIIIIAGIVLFKEKIVLTKIIGASLIIFSNIFIFYNHGKIKLNKYVLIMLIASLCSVSAKLLDISNSDSYNLPIYVAAILIIPAIFIIIFERIKISDIKETINTNKKAILIAGASQGIVQLCGLRAYQLGQVTTIAPLVALTVILNVIAGYLFLNERSNLVKKIIAAILIIISVILIKM